MSNVINLLLKIKSRRILPLSSATVKLVLGADVGIIIGCILLGILISVVMSMMYRKIVTDFFLNFQGQFLTPPQTRYVTGFVSLLALLLAMIQERVG